MDTLINNLSLSVPFFYKPSCALRGHPLRPLCLHLTPKPGPVLTLALIPVVTILFSRTGSPATLLLACNIHRLSPTFGEHFIFYPVPILDKDFLYRFPSPSVEDASPSEAPETVQRPLTPSSVAGGPLPSLKIAESSPSTLDYQEPLSLDDLAIYRRQSHSMKIRRRRVDRDSRHPLLTPPLTPSSSLRTTTSIDSTGHNDPNETNDNIFHIQDIDERSTRFLLVRY